MREVDLDEIAVSSAADCSCSEGTPLFVANGISTCIAIILHGEVNGTLFAAMLHWPGFEDQIDKKNSALMLEAVYSLFVKIEQQIIAEFNLTASSPITIRTIDIIGGEKKQKDRNNRLIVSGTEKEVKYLKKYAAEICEEMFEMRSDSIIRFANFLTTNNDVINIQVFLDGLRYQHIKNRSPKKLLEDPADFLIATEHNSIIEPEESLRRNIALA